MYPDHGQDRSRAPLARLNRPEPMTLFREVKRCWEYSNASGCYSRHHLYFMLSGSLLYKRLMTNPDSLLSYDYACLLLRPY